MVIENQWIASMVDKRSVPRTVQVCVVCIAIKSHHIHPKYTHLNTFLSHTIFTMSFIPFTRPKFTFSFTLFFVSNHLPYMPYKPYIPYHPGVYAMEVEAVPFPYESDTAAGNVWYNGV